MQLIIVFLIFICPFSVKADLPTTVNDAIQIGREDDGKTLIPLKYERVIDGDTFIGSGRKIRLWGIDAPEKGEPYYEVSRIALDAFLYEAELSCKLIDFDRYDREVMHCTVDGGDLGALMTKSGFATDYKKYSGGFYARDQAFAEEHKIGMWKE